MIALVVAACGGGTAGAGGERAACRADGTCDVGLECWSGVCVRPPAADCGAVAARLASVRLGNYAGDDERRPVLAELRALCARERLTAREGRCLIAAADDDALAACPRPLLPELDPVKRRCAPLADRVAVLAVRGGDLATAVGPTGAGALGEKVVDACVRGAWPAAATTCVGDATDLDGLVACVGHLPTRARAGLDRTLAELRRRGPRVPPPDPWATRPTGRLTGACARYVELLERYTTCDQVPANARAAIQQSIDTMKATWSQTPPNLRAQVDSACASANDALADGMRSLGCNVP